MQSQVDAMKRRVSSTEKDHSKPKRKKIRKSNNNEKLNNLCKLSEEMFNLIVSEGRKEKLFKQLKPVELLDNNASAKLALTDLQSVDICPKMSVGLGSEETIIFENNQHFKELFSNYLYLNVKNEVLKLAVSTNSYLIPPLSSFICGDAKFAVDFLIKSNTSVVV